MKRIYIVFEEEEFKMLKKAKKKLTWHDFVMLLTKRKLKPTTEGDIEPELEVETELMDDFEAGEIIKKLDKHYDSYGKSMKEIREHANELLEKRNKNEN